MVDNEVLRTDNPRPIRYKEGNDVRSVVALNTAPLDAVELRNRIIEASGITVDELGATLRKAYDRLVSALDATKAIPITWHGEVTDVFEGTDHRAILKAVEVFADLFGVAATPRNTSSEADTNISVTVVNWFDDPPKNVSPKDITPQP